MRTAKCVWANVRCLQHRQSPLVRNRAPPLVSISDQNTKSALSESGHDQPRIAESSLCSGNESGPRIAERLAHDAQPLINLVPQSMPGTGVFAFIGFPDNRVELEVVRHWNPLGFQKEGWFCENYAFDRWIVRGGDWYLTILRNTLSHLRDERTVDHNFPKLGKSRRFLQFRGRSHSGAEATSALSAIRPARPHRPTADAPTWIRLRLAELL